MNVSDERRRLQADLARLERHLADMGEHAPAEMSINLDELRKRAQQVDERHVDLQQRLDALRRSARRSKPAYEAMTVEIPKWRTVILLGLNSAAIAAVLGNEKLPLETVQASSLAFLAGSLAALGSGSMLDKIGRSGLEYVDELDRADLDLEATDDHGLAHADTANKNLIKSRGAAESLRACSILLFAVGVIFAAFRLQLW